jgi:hypothetical protein
MWRIDPLPSGESVNRQFLGSSVVNTFMLLGSRFLIMQPLRYNSGRSVFSVWSVLRCYKQGTRSVDKFAMGVCEERT